MTDYSIATGAEQPINRHAGAAVEVFHEADPVGLTDDGDGNAEVRVADADASVAQPALGVSLAPVSEQDPNFPDFVNNQIVAERMAVVGEDDRVTFIQYGIVLEDNERDEADALDIGEPVYLAKGGGFTQTQPSEAGDLIQVVGYAIEEHALVVDVDPHYEVA